MSSEGFVPNNTSGDYNIGQHMSTMGLDSPPSYDYVINSCPMAGAAQPSPLGYSNAVVGGVESYGRTLFAFKAEFPNELSLKGNEIVHLIRHIDNEWIEGEVDGKVGIFPKSFIEIVVDCEQNTGSNANGMHSTSITEDFPADTFGRVLYDFDGEIEGDLKVRKGDTLTMIRKIDTNWLEVMDDLGNIGLVPKDFCELIDDNLSIHSRTTSLESGNESIVQSNGIHVYSDNLSINDNLTPVATHTDIKPVILQEFDPIVSENNRNGNFLFTDHTVTETKLSPKIPRRPAPAVPKSSDETDGKQQMSPHRPPPPVPKHKNIRRVRDTSDSNHFDRQESIRSSITSNSSSSSAKSDTASGGTATVEDQKRVDERRKKVREQRGCVITELLQTERDYKESLKVCADIFLQNPDKARSVGIDLGLLFGNLKEIIEVSTHLNQLLEESTLMKNYEQQRVGKCFLQIEEQMRSAYSLYCKNHDEIQPLWDRYQAQTEAKQFLEQAFEVMREKTNCFDIPSVLIKPVQRILKYPLLLNELHKCTEEGHEDKPDLILAIDKITNMATNINELKRRQDLVQKYQREGCHTIGARLSKINLHTFRKKGLRLGHRITSTLGLSNTTKDDEFNSSVQKFRTVEKTIKIFVKDKQAFMRSAQEFSNQGLTVVEAIGEYYDKKNRQQEVEQLRTTHREIVGHYYHDFNAAVERDVTPVLDKLLSKFSGPNKLINKRFDKLTDYDSVTKKLESNKDINRQKNLQEQQQMAKNVYEALNTQLLEELPKFCELSMQILQDCIQAFLIARKQLIGRIAKHHLALLELPLVMGFSTGSSADIDETFQIKHNIIIEQLLDEISILPTNVFPNASSSLNSSQTDISRRQSTRNSRRSLNSNNIHVSVANSTTVGLNHNVNKNAIQSPSQRAYLQSRYQSHQLYEVVKPHEACDILDIYLKAGDLVGVVKQQDPMGGRHRWFVDAGSAQGFVLANCLIPYRNNSWVTPPRSEEKTRLTNISEKSALNFSQNQTPIQTPPPVQHHYKLHPAPEPPVQLRNDVEQHRYEKVDDSPPRYSKLDISGNNLLSFDESDVKHIENPPNYSIDAMEFDPYAPTAPTNRSANNSLTTVVEHRYEEIPDETPTVSPSVPQRQLSTEQSINSELYFAAFPFRGNDKNQLNLEFGQPVIVNHKCDRNGNTEWWFVTDRDDNSGYVPANYLTKHQSK